MELLLNHTNHTPDATSQPALKGNSTAQEHLYRKYARAMYHICVRLTGDRLLAEDILHDAFVLAFQNLKSLKNELAFGGWLKQIVIRQCLKQLKKSQVVVMSAVDIDIQEDNDIGWIQEIRFDQIHKAITELPEGCRQVFTLYAVEDWSHHDIAVELGISESTSKSQYQRARKLLRNKLTKYLNG
jgi:RNA polymerase sigma-70 factor (ECF subfamily)